MTVSFRKLSIVGAVLVLLAGCSLTGEKPDAGLWNAQQSEELARAGKLDALSACPPEAGSPFAYRKALLVAGTIGASGIARDLPGLAPLTSQRLQTHLDATGRFNVYATHASSFESMGSGTAARVRQLGREYDSQFVVKIELEDLTVHSSRSWLRKLTGGSDKRSVMIKLYMYDVEYGSLFHSQRYQRTVKGKIVGYPGSGKTVAAPWFSTDLGKEIDDILTTMSRHINEKLACVPFAAEVTTLQGADIHLNAGFLHGIRTGETLRVYKRRNLLMPVETGKMGDNEGWISVHTVFPNHSIASAVEGRFGDSRPDITDVVRAW